MGVDLKAVAVIQIHDDGALFSENASEDRGNKRDDWVLMMRVRQRAQDGA